MTSVSTPVVSPSEVALEYDLLKYRTRYDLPSLSEAHEYTLLKLELNMFTQISKSTESKTMRAINLHNKHINNTKANIN